MKSVEWLAGLLEGEGYFRASVTNSHLSPQIGLNMTDRDVVERAAEMMNSRVTQKSESTASWRMHWKPQFRTSKAGLQALAIMLQVFPFMGERRRKKINEILSKWEHQFGLTSR